MKSKTSLLALLAIIIIAGIFIIKATGSKKQFILIGVDGMQYEHYAIMLAEGKLPNYKRLIENGISATARITGHSETSTAPGNAELFTGLPSSVTTIADNSCEKTIPKGLTIFERLRAHDASIRLGLIYGKKNCYVPEAVLSNAKAVVHWWLDTDQYEHRQYISAAYADSRDVSAKALEFLKKNKSRSFFLTMYFGGPDAAGHAYGENSKEYAEALINTDQALGVLLDWMQEKDLKTPIILTSDHGWNEGSKEHSINTTDALMIPMVSNDSSIITPTSEKKQCSVAPTIYKYFEVDSSAYTDVTEAACLAM